jgi:hypothetical protein
MSLEACTVASGHAIAFGALVVGCHARRMGGVCAHHAQDTHGGSDHSAR